MNNNDYYTDEDKNDLIKIFCLALFFAMLIIAFLADQKTVSRPADQNTNFPIDSTYAITHSK